MGILLPFARRHVRASAGSRLAILREANSVRSSAVTPPVLPVSDSKMGCHHSAGMLSRWSHLRADATDAPISDAIAPGDRQRPMTARNVSSGGGTMDVTESPLRQFVLNDKPILSYDCGGRASDNWPMAKDQGVSAHRDAFVRRVRRAREGRYRTQQELCDVLEIAQPKYDKYERRSYLPHHLLWRFCQACGVDLKWLVTGRGRQPMQLEQETPEPVRHRRRAPKAA